MYNTCNSQQPRGNLRAAVVLVAAVSLLPVAFSPTAVAAPAPVPPPAALAAGGHPTITGAAGRAHLRTGLHRFVGTKALRAGRTHGVRVRNGSLRIGSPTGVRRLVDAYGPSRPHRYPVRHVELAVGPCGALVPRAGSQLERDDSAGHPGPGGCTGPPPDRPHQQLGPPGALGERTAARLPPHQLGRSARRRRAGRGRHRPNRPRCGALATARHALPPGEHRPVSRRRVGRCHHLAPGTQPGSYQPPRTGPW